VENLTGIMRNGDAEYKTKSLDGIKPNTNPKTNTNLNTNPILLSYAYCASLFCKIPIADLLLLTKSLYIRRHKGTLQGYIYCSRLVARWR